MADAPPGRKSRGFRLFPSSWAGRCAFVSVIWGALMLAGWALNARWDDAPPVNRPIKQPADDYVSSDSCRSCHPGNYASWHASFHRRMTQVAKPENILADMTGLELRNSGKAYRVGRDGDTYYVETKAAGAPDSAYAHRQDIVLLTGSHHQQICWLSTDQGRTLEQLPFSYIVAEKKWVHIADVFLVPPGPHDDVYTVGDWNTNCINCHTTRGRQKPVGGMKYDSAVTDFGISCEACHSGGRRHIELNRDPIRRFMLHFTQEPDPTIANPARMDGPASSLVCGQCHSVSNFNSPAAYAQFSQHNSKYRPGMKQLDLRWIVQPNDPAQHARHASLERDEPGYMINRFWGDGMIRVTGREFNGTSASPCYQGGHFSCLSCHDLHPHDASTNDLKDWADDQLRPDVTSDQSCLPCHRDVAANIPAHTHHAPASAGSSCINCHMPHTTLGLMKAVRSHQISSPSAHESLAYHRPNACNLCHLDQPLAWVANALHAWYGQPVPAMDRDDRELAAGAKWILEGDAGERAIVVWSMGWEPAQHAAGYDWFYPYLAFELNDPYAVVRFRALKSLQSLPGFSDFEYDYTVGDAQQKQATLRAYQQWWQQQRNAVRPYRWQTILQPTGEFRQETYDRLLNQRDARPVYLVE